MTEHPDQPNVAGVYDYGRRLRPAFAPGQRQFTFGLRLRCP
jgi:hypothetical protein